VSERIKGVYGSNSNPLAIRVWLEGMGATDTGDVSLEYFANEDRIFFVNEDNEFDWESCEYMRLFDIVSPLDSPTTSSISKSKCIRYVINSLFDVIGIDESNADPTYIKNHIKAGNYYVSEGFAREMASSLKDAFSNFISPRAKGDDPYYIISSEGQIIECTEYEDSDDYLSVGNYFDTYLDACKACIKWHEVMLSRSESEELSDVYDSEMINPHKPTINESVPTRPFQSASEFMTALINHGGPYGYLVHPTVGFALPTHIANDGVVLECMYFSYSELVSEDSKWRFYDGTPCVCDK